MAAPVFTWEMTTIGFSDFVANLSSISGKDYDYVLANQTGKVLEVAARETPARSATDIDRSVKFKNRNLRDREQGEPLIVGKLNGAVLFVDPSTARPGQKTGRKVRSLSADGKSALVAGAKTFHVMNSQFRRWSDERWARYQAALALLEDKKIDLGKAKGSRGVAKHTWEQCAEALGIQLDVPGYVHRARPANGREYRNGTARRLAEGGIHYIEIANDYPALANPGVTRGKVDGRAILQKAIDKRLIAFGIDTAKGVFDDVKARAQRYPGIFVEV